MLSPSNISVEKVVHGTPEQVFAILADPRRHPEIDGSGTLVGAIDGPPKLSKGAVFGMGMKVGIGYAMTNTVVEYEEDRRIAWQARPTKKIGAMIAGGRIWRYELEPVEGGTRVRETWDISQERIPPLVWPASLITGRNMTRTLDRLEELLR